MYTFKVRANKKALHWIITTHPPSVDVRHNSALLNQSLACRMALRMGFTLGIKNKARIRPSANVHGDLKFANSASIS